VQLRSKAWGIRWGRALARELGLPLVESTETTDRDEALRILRAREIQIAERRGDRGRLEQLHRSAPAVPLAELVTDFLRAFAAGELPGAKPGKSTLEGYLAHLLGKKGGLLAFAGTLERHTSDRLDRVLVERWLESERGCAPDTLRLKLIAARRLVAYAADRGLVTKERAAAVREVRAPASARGRARVEGVPSETEVKALVDALSPSWWRPVAELQLRLGLRRAEVLAIELSWIDPGAGVVRVLPGGGFDTKSHEPRTIDGVDPATIALALEVVQLKGELRAKQVRRGKPAIGFSISGYVEAWKRACRRLERAGTPWRYRSKTHGLRSAYATASRIAGVPLPVVRDRLGHASERTTERHYLGRTVEVVPGPFAGVPRLTAEQHQGGKVIPLRAPVLPSQILPSKPPRRSSSIACAADTLSPKRHARGWHFFRSIGKSANLQSIARAGEEPALGRADDVHRPELPSTRDETQDKPARRGVEARGAAARPVVARPLERSG
jgi:integrase